MIPAGGDHGEVTAELARIIGNHVHDHSLGRVYGAETGFLLARNPDTVRAPDCAFVRARHAPVSSRGFVPQAPDLAVEVLSPDDRPGYVREKVAEWLESGTEIVWVVDPRQRTVAIHGGGSSGRTLRESDVLPGGELLPGFEIPVADLFPR